jgi:hypothetical protein
MFRCRLNGDKFPNNSTITLMSSSEFLDQPFWLLGVDPAAKREQIQAALEIAKRRNLVTDETFSAAYQFCSIQRSGFLPCSMSV